MTLLFKIELRIEIKSLVLFTSPGYACYVQNPGKSSRLAKKFQIGIGIQLKVIYQVIMQIMQKPILFESILQKKNKSR